MEELQHYGTPRHSGRYPWGSGKNPQRNKNFYSRVKELEKQGMREKDIAQGFGISTTQLRAKMTIAVNEITKENIDRAIRLKEKGYSNGKIAELMGMPKSKESTIRNWLKNGYKVKEGSLESVANELKRLVDEKGYIDIGKGAELSLNTTQTNLNTAIEMLREEGYVKTNVQVVQSGAKNANKTTIKVLAPPGTTYKDVKLNKGQIRPIEEYEQDGQNITKLNAMPPVHSISSDRIQIRYPEDGGAGKDGIIEIRRGVEDLSLGNAHYAQVRIGVDGTHYLKGMALYADDADMPPGVDIIFNTSKPSTKGKMDILKKMKTIKDDAGNDTGVIDQDNPFGASIKGIADLTRVPRYYTDKDGKQQVSPINVVNEEGDWGAWSKTLASQMLAKQPLNLVNRQLKLSYDINRAEFESIKELSNPVVKKKMLESFASDMDASAVHLKAASLPGQTSAVILPLPKIKENQIFAPNYTNGEQVALIRYPHGGVFEIPVLTVNNNDKSGRSTIGTTSPDAVGIHPSAAAKLSGADFDGDTVVIIPFRNGVHIKADQALEGLKNFDPKTEYAIDRSDPIQAKIPPLTNKAKQKMMGMTTNLIMDMTIKGAPTDELVRAVRHSMVIIDAEKHDLDWRKSERLENLQELREKYQIQNDGRVGGASTLITRAKSPTHIDTRKEAGWDKETGEKLYKELPNDTYPIKDKKTGEIKEIRHRKTESTQMADTDDATTLISNFQTATEKSYAKYANQLKGLANEARKEYLDTENPKRDPEAAKAYEVEVASLKNKLNNAKKNAPRERQALLIADQVMEMKRAEHEIDNDTAKKMHSQALASARVRVGAHKDQIEFTEREWEAVQHNAIAPTTLSEILNNAKMDQVKKLAMPKTNSGLSTAEVALIKSMAKSSGYTIEELAERYNVSSSTISKAIAG